MKFNNKENTPYDIDGKTIWHSRNVAVVGVIILIINNIPYVLASKRGLNAFGNQGKMNLVTGYLDWNESGTEAVYRECWEETGFNLPEHMKKFNIIKNNLNDPWVVATQPDRLLQNVSLRYGIIMETEGEFPTLSTDYNEVEGESENPSWIPLSDIEKYEWAYNHNNLIKDYYNLD